jgi:hypothetical protein
MYLNMDPEAVKTKISAKTLTTRSFGLTDTFIVSYTRIQDIYNALTELNPNGLNNVIANMTVPHDTVYYVNGKGVITKYTILEFVSV